MKPVPISAARAIGEQSQARKVVVILVDDDTFAVTTWGNTRDECRALAEWSENSTDEIAAALAAL